MKPGELEQLLADIWMPKEEPPSPPPAPASVREVARLVLLARAHRDLADRLAVQAGKLMVELDRNEQNAARI